MATNSKKDPKFIRQRQLAMFIPVLGVPFLCVMFWLGGGGTNTPASAAPVNVGFNVELPSAGETTITDNKLKAYDAPLDSTRNQGLVASRPDTVAGNGLAYGVGPNGEAGPNGSADKTVIAAQQQLLEAQQQQLNGGNPAPTAADASSASSASAAIEAEQARQERQRQLEDAATQRQIAMLLAQSNAADRGVAAAPSRVATKAKAPKKAKTKAVVVDDNAIVSQLGNNGTGKRRTAGFHGFDSGTESNEDANTLPAVIHESQEVVSGSLVKMRLTAPAVVNGHRLAANTFIYGVCSLQGERLSITIETLKDGGRVFPAALEVFDVDGLAGLHIPGAITRDAAKSAGADGLSAADALTMSADPGMAAAGVAVSAVKGLGQKKIRMVKVRLKAGYNIMLKIDTEDN